MLVKIRSSSRYCPCYQATEQLGVNLVPEQQNRLCMVLTAILTEGFNSIHAEDSGPPRVLTSQQATKEAT